MAGEALLQLSECLQARINLLIRHARLASPRPQTLQVLAATAAHRSLAPPTNCRHDNLAALSRVARFDCEKRTKGRRTKGMRPANRDRGAAPCGRHHSPDGGLDPRCYGYFSPSLLPV